MKNEHQGHRIRLRERVDKEGLENFHDYQVLEYALTFAIPYKDTNVIAHRLINRFGSFSGVLEADKEDLAKVEGMGEASAHFISNLLSILHYYEADKAKKVDTINSTQESYYFAKQFLIGKLIEEMYLICLSPKNKVVMVKKIAEGTSSEANINMRIIIENMGKAKVNSIIVAHNHPKGKAEPSLDDNKFTKALVASLAINGCRLIDHIIIGEDEEYYSYREHAIIDKYLDEVAGLVNFKSIAQPMPKYEVSRHDKK